MEKRIIVLKYGESVFNENYIFRGGCSEKMLPISFVIYLIQEGERNILVDAGCNDGAGFNMSVFCKPVDILKEYGLLPEDITDIVITHHHHDHIEAVKDYPKAIIYMQKDEYELGRDYIPTERQVELFKEEKWIAEGILVKKIGGHSKGSCIVLCRYHKQDYVFCGDECYVNECFKQGIATGSSYAPEVSERFVQEYGTGQYKLLLFHEPNILKGKIGYKVLS